MKLNQTELYAALDKLIDRIEGCGTSTELTNAVVLASDIRQAVGNEWNVPNEFAATRVRRILPENVEVTRDK
jgi:hypothetical protein